MMLSEEWTEAVECIVDGALEEIRDASDLEWPTPLSRLDIERLRSHLEVAAREAFKRACAEMLKVVCPMCGLDKPGDPPKCTSCGSVGDGVSRAEYKRVVLERDLSSDKDIAVSSEWTAKDTSAG